nr:T9SS type A sorting domain-containing protein [Hymenobacter siberiensis]
MVERSADGHRFNELGRVEAQGSTTFRHDYTLVDNAPLTGLSYYRLRQVDNDGILAYSPVATVHYAPEGAAPVLQAYPSPATHDGFQVAVTNLTGSAGSTVQVFDNVGRLVFTQAVDANTMQAAIKPTHPLASGMYFVTWTTESAKLTIKVVIE